MRTPVSLSNDIAHFRSCHLRWSQRMNRDTDAPGYKDEWYSEQCLFCRYLIPLSGAFAEDYGACSNEASPFDGKVMFEHDGCDNFSPTG